MKQIKNNIQLKIINASRGIERREVIKNGGTWIRPSMCIETKKKYDRNRLKREFRKGFDY